MAGCLRPRVGGVVVAASVLLLTSACQAAGEPALPPATPEETATRTPVVPETPLPTAVAVDPSEPFGIDVVTLHGDGRSVPVSVYVADTADLRARGLMGREHLPAGTGMLFVYDADTTGTFWMRDTLIPLSIGFFDADGDAVAFFDMEPCTTPICPSYGPDTPYRHALEVPQGWFDDQGVDLDWDLDVS